MAEINDFSREADPYNLARFLEAQSGSVRGSDYKTALSELQAGRKRSHWIWYIFPQIEGLGSTDYAVRFSIKSLDEARTYLAHPILGPRLIECAEAVLAIEGRSAVQIFGDIDRMKLRSSMTLFAQVTGSDSVFTLVLEKYFYGEPDSRTISILNGVTAQT
ncbi:MAG TPA: DUF1810 domain-containing protein [Pyrinomonadaceae bacterium]|jgi:uncharacterized protein (DUF1810 family)|nr:DUF1810 domain-containing protein [Pyrinomonadaceae bacterium]